MLLASPYLANPVCGRAGAAGLMDGYLALVEYRSMASDLFREGFSPET